MPVACVSFSLALPHKSHFTWYFLHRFKWDSKANSVNDPTFVTEPKIFSCPENARRIAFTPLLSSSIKYVMPCVRVCMYEPIVALHVSMYFRCCSHEMALEFIIQHRKWNCIAVSLCDHRSFVRNMNWVWSRLQRSTMAQPMMMLSGSLRRDQGRGHHTIFVHNSHADALNCYHTTPTECVRRFSCVLHQLREFDKRDLLVVFKG